MKKIKLRANAKVNLSIDVLGRLENGYHELDMIIQEIDLCDSVSIQKRDDDQIRIHTNWDLPCNGDNIAYKAVRYMKELYGIDRGYDIVIDKRIPIESGLAGGSSDGAAVIKGMILLEELEDLPTRGGKILLDHAKLQGVRSKEEEQADEVSVSAFDLYEILDLSIAKERDLHLFDEFSLDVAKKIGCDVSFFTRGKTMRVCGIGDVLSRMENNLDYYFVIVKPDLNILTKWVYTNLKTDLIRVRPDNDEIQRGLKEKDFKKMTANMYNVLEEVVMPHYPVIAKIKEQLLQHHAQVSLMSGSGSSVFGIFKEYDSAQSAFEALHAQYKNTYLCKGF